MKSGIALGFPVIKLLKGHWSISPRDVMINSNGVFFSVWLDGSKPGDCDLRYNIHAKKFREAGYPRIAARDFATKFRMMTDELVKSWPSVTYPKGPGTLLEGRLAYVRETLSDDVLQLLRRFTRLAPAIDDLLTHR